MILRDSMRKRTFLKLLSAGISGPATPVLPSAQQSAKKERLTNWAGNLTYSTDRVHEARSVDQIRSLLRSQDKWKVLGSRHCFNNIADTPHHFLSVKPDLERAVINEQARTVTVDGSLKYGELSPLIHRRGFALHNLASLPHISIAGACSTATHGSGVTSGNLATAVSGLQLVTASGEVVELSRRSDSAAFRASVVSLGALGVITRVTLKLEPAFAVRQWVYQNLPMAQLKEHFDAIQSSAYSVSLFTDWQKQRVNEVWIKSRVGSKPDFSAPPEF